MSKRKYDFDEFDREKFADILYTMMLDKPCFNNFMFYLQSLYENEENLKLKKAYGRKLRALEKRGPEKYLKYSDIALVTQRDVSTVERWLKESPPPLPDISVLPILSKAFGVSTDCLLGLVSTPEVERGEFQTLNELNLDIDLLQRKYNLLSNEQEDFIYVLRALELLLNSSLSFSILINIGKYLTSNNLQIGYLYAGDSIIKVIHQIIEEYSNEGDLDAYIEKKLSEEALSKTKMFTELAIETIISELKRYKEELKTSDTTI